MINALPVVIGFKMEREKFFISQTYSTGGPSVRKVQL